MIYNIKIDEKKLFLFGESPGQTSKRIFFDSKVEIKNILLIHQIIVVLFLNFPAYDRHLWCKMGTKCRSDSSTPLFSSSPTSQFSFFLYCLCNT